MKESRELLRKAGEPIYRVSIAFSVVKSFMLLPLMSLIWRLLLMTTPEGFISNANIGITLLKSPWIIVFGVLLVGNYLFFSMWQITATVLGIAYAKDGKSPKLLDLLKISANDLWHAIRPKNIMLLLYVAIIIPFTNIFQASELVGAFVVPEYIMDFIESKMIPYVFYVAIMIIATYFALRWFYLLPSFFLKEHDFESASKESFSFTKKGFFKNGIKLMLYAFIESIRLAIVPFIVIIVVCGIAYLAVATKPYAYDVFTLVAEPIAENLISVISGVFVYLSSMCYLVNDYYKRCDDKGTTLDINLPELTKETKLTSSGKLLAPKTTIGGALVIAALYIACLFAVNVNPVIMKDLIYNPSVVAHKGYSSKAPENTMDAFELADKTENADFIELDVWSSKDGVPVVVHNETITAATGLDGNVYDYTYEELKQIPAPYAMSPDKFPDARIPSLEEVISKYSKTTPILIEIKGYKKDEQLPAKIVALMEKYDIVETSMIHSGDYLALKAVKTINPDIKCGLIQAIVTGNSYDLPYADFLSVEHSFVTKNMVDQLHKRNKELYVWTVNYEDSVSKLKNLGIDGFITDYPDKIAELVGSPVDLIENVTAMISTENLNSVSAIRQFDEGDY